MWQQPADFRFRSVVRVTPGNAQAVLGGTIDSTKLYMIDGIVDMGSVSINVPSTGIQIKGEGTSISKIISTEPGFTLFSGATAGNVLLEFLTIVVSGAGSQVYDLTADGAFRALEANSVNYGDADSLVGCSSLGEVTDYRQGLEFNTGRFGGQPNLTLSGSWAGGFRIAVAIARALDSGMTGALFQAGTALVFSSRFRNEMNVDLPASAAFLDFAAANFNGSSLLQMQQAIVTRNGVFDPEDTNITPNIQASALECYWRNNQGVPSTHVGCTLTVSTEAATTIAVLNTWYTVAGTWTLADAVHFDSPANNQMRNLGNTPRDFSVQASIVVEGTSNDVIELRWMKYDFSTTSLAAIPNSEQRVVIASLAGSRDVGIASMLAPVISLDEGDYIYLQVRNTVSTDNVTVENGTRVRVLAL
jgi:hypothetical protein